MLLKKLSDTFSWTLKKKSALKAFLIKVKWKKNNVVFYSKTDAQVTNIKNSDLN